MKYPKLAMIVGAIGFFVSHLVFGQAPVAKTTSQITITTTPSVGSAAIRIVMPADAQIDTLSVVLNGNDVGKRFARVDCSEGVCEQTTLAEPDGLRPGKNVLQVLAKRNDGRIISARERFSDDVLTTSAPRPQLAGSAPVHANAVSTLPTLNSFLPPAIAFTTLVPGGYNGSAWIQVGSQNTYPANPSSYTCTGLYTVIVLDRRTLQEKTSAPESSPNCINDGSSLSTYLNTLNASDLVIVGSNFGVNSDAGSGHGQLNTAAIGGRAYNCLSASDCSSLPSTTVTSSNVPLGYMAIGVGGAASGSAFENYYGQNYNWVLVNPHATGMLVEDANGNYNFQPSTAIEYTVVPNDATNSGVSTITVGSVPGDPYYSQNLTSKLYTPPGGTGQNGMWMLILQRSTLYSVPFNVAGTPPPVANQDACAQTGTSGTVAVFHGCGVFYDTGDSIAANATAAYSSLMGDLEDAAADPTELVFLVSVGNQPGYPDTNGVKLIPSGLANAFSSIGGTPETLTNLNTPGSTYSYVGCSGCGNSLGGNVVISTNLQSQQGQNGYIHGLLEPNLNGIYWPTQASLDQPASAAQPTTDFTIQEVTSSPPVEWPELSNVQKLAVTGSGTTYTSDSTAGQNAAYYYISYQLINQHYILGAQGSYIDDIHYYFTGGSNTFLDYHAYDPVNLVYPGSSCYQWTDPVPGRGTLACFTQNDFNAVRAQIHNEIVYLTNVLQYMVNGSTNMKDIVASGGGSAALALINAAASVQASTLQPPPATPVKASVSNILNFVGNIVSVGATIALGAGALEGDAALKSAISNYGSFAGAISGAFGMASAVTSSGGLGLAGSSATPLPSKNYTFLTTIGNLSNNSLQQSLTAGFDTGLDTILGDWYKLSTIGPKITDSNNPAFQPATQTASLIGIQQIGQASQRTFYTALLPINYSVQHYTYWYGQKDITNSPDMGAPSDDNWENCNTWYWAGSPPSWINLVSKSYGSYSDEGPSYNWGFYYNGNDDKVTIPMPLDWFLIASSATPSNRGTINQRIQMLDSQVAATLFSPGQLNIPLDAFLDQNGPMASVWWDSSKIGFDQFPANQTCSLYVAQHSKNGPPPVLGASQPNPVQVSLKIPAIGVLGDNIALKATASVASGPVTSGMIVFYDGGNELGRAALDSTGTATLQVNALTLGLHKVSAAFVASTQYTTTTPVEAALVIYANDADLTLTPSAGSLTVANGATSSPISLQVTSKWGLAGAVAFSCSGLPTGATCNFSPAQVTLADGASGTTSLTITSKTQVAQIHSSPRVFAAMLLPMSLLLLRRKRIATRSLTAMTLLGILISMGSLTGCSSSSSAPVAQSSSSTVLVTATSGNISRSVPIAVTVQ